MMAGAAMGAGRCALPSRLAHSGMSGMAIGAGREDGLEPAGARLVRGDSNSDGSINLTDGVIPLIFLFSGGAPPACMDSADANAPGNIEITDALTAHLN